MPHCPVCQASISTADGATIPWECLNCHERFVGRYVGLQLISAGEMGEVYEGWDSRDEFGRVAIKFPRSREPEANRRFQREIEASTQLQDENIVRAFEHGQEAGRFYLVMEFVQGERLDKLVGAQHPLPVERVVRYLVDLAAGLEFAANSHIVNRDIKPSNILITDDDRAKILDFGLALIADLDHDVHDRTRAGMTLGTPAYMAPEQTLDAHNVTIEADVYALGCTIFFCLTGRQPFLDVNLAGVQRRHAAEPRPSIRDSRPDVSADLQTLVWRMMAITANDRPRPSEIRVRATQLLTGQPLNDIEPVHNHAAELLNTEPFDVACPTCHEVYHLQSNALGQFLTCTNPRCQPFKVESHLIVSKLPTPASADLTYVEAVAVEDDDLDQTNWQSSENTIGGTSSQFEKAGHSQHRAETVDFVTGEAVDDDEPEWTSVDEIEEEFGESTTAPAAEEDHYEPGGFPWRVALLGLVVLGGVFGVMGSMAYKRLNPPPDTVWEHIVSEEFGLSHWDVAATSFEKFGQDYPTFAKSAYVPFFVDLCNAQNAAKNDPAAALLDRLNGIYRKYRDEEVYALYANYLYDLTQRPVERFLEEAKRSHDVEKIEQANTAFQLFSTVAKSMKDEWVPERVAKIEELLKSSTEQVQRDRSRDVMLAELKQLRESAATIDPDKVYARYEALKIAYPQLARDKQLEDELHQAEQFEVQQVTYEVAPPFAGEANDARAKNRATAPSTTLWMLESAPPQKKDARDTSVVLALARGVLYAFNSHGVFRWAHRLGVDCDGLPLRIPETPTSPPLLLAASPGEGRLLALDARDGAERWSYKLDGAIFTAPTLVTMEPLDGETTPRTWGLLPTAAGDIHVLELVLGKRVGTIHLNKPLATGGKYDLTTRLVYFPAENKRLFAIDPAVLDDPTRPACRSILFTNHSGGSLRSEPIIAGPYLILNQAAGFDTTVLRVFRIHEGGFRSPHDGPLKEETLAGWTWHPPLVSPDRVTFCHRPRRYWCLWRELEY